MVRAGMILCGLMYLCGACMTESPSDDVDEVAATSQALSREGPFASNKSLISFWTDTSTGGAAVQIFVNGHLVYERSGFGPAFIKQYFVCAGGTSIYATCPTGFFDGFETFSELVSRSPSTATIYEDGVLVRSGTNPFESEQVDTCTGEQSFIGPIHYYKVTSYTSGFVSYFGACYP